MSSTRAITLIFGLLAAAALLVPAPPATAHESAPPATLATPASSATVAVGATSAAGAG
jgi:hypothetical protein